MCKTLFRGKPTNLIDLDALPEYHKWVKDGWVYGYLIGKNVIVGEIVDFEEGYLKTEFWCRVRPETVGQFTGLRDNNGIGIYEGDIIRYKLFSDKPPSKRPKKKYISVCRRVCWDNKCASYELEREYEVREYPYSTTYNYGWRSDCEVVGNIHDNPELLEASNE